MTACYRTERLSTTTFDQRWTRAMVVLANSATPIVGDSDNEQAAMVHWNRLLGITALADHIGQIAVGTRKSRADR